MPNPGEVRGASVARRYTFYGALAGALGGGFVGVAVAGPNFQEWAPWESAMTVLGSTMLMAFMGHMAVAWALGSVAHGNTGEPVSSGHSLFVGGTSEGGDGGDGGGGGAD